jgi:hypothetical protein
MRLTRRRLLGWAVAGAAAAIGLGSVGYYVQRPRTYGRQDVIDHMLHAFAYLNPDPRGVGQFVDLYLVHYNSQPPSNSMQFAEQIFLLSTDFFQSGQPPAGPLRFVLLYHPYAFPCYNPMAAPA